MSNIKPKSPKNRCTFCRRGKRRCLKEQTSSGEPCDALECEFEKEIKEAIEANYLLNIKAKVKKPINVIERLTQKIKIVKKK